MATYGLLPAEPGLLADGGGGRGGRGSGGGRGGNLSAARGVAQGALESVVRAAKNATSAQHQQVREAQRDTETLCANKMRNN